MSEDNEITSQNEEQQPQADEHLKHAQRPEGTKVDKPRGMGHSFAVANSTNEADRKRKAEEIRAKVDKQSTQPMPEFSMEFFLHPQVDIVLRTSQSLQVALEDWNKNAQKGLPDVIKSHVVVPVTAFNLSKHFELYAPPGGGKAMEHMGEVLDKLIESHDLEYAFAHMQKEGNKFNPLHKLYSDMKEAGIDVHFSSNPDLASQDPDHKGHTSYFVYTPNIYQTDNERMKFVKYLVDGGYISKEQVRNAIDDTHEKVALEKNDSNGMIGDKMAKISQNEAKKETLMKHLESHELPNTRITQESMLAMNPGYLTR